MNGYFNRVFLTGFAGSVTRPNMLNRRVIASNPFECSNCGRRYKHRKSLHVHITKECGKTPSLSCPHCPFITYRKYNINKHITNKHPGMQLY